MEHTKLCVVRKEANEATKLRERLTEDLSILSKTSKTLREYYTLSSVQNREENLSDDLDTD
jgi:uncharacterized protein with ATP-grasp and redox domains